MDAFDGLDCSRFPFPAVANNTMKTIKRMMSKMIPAIINFSRFDNPDDGERKGFSLVG